MLAAPVDDPVDLVEGRHDIQKQDRKREYVAIADGAMQSEVGGDSQEHNMEKALVEGFAAAEQRHGEMMAHFPEAALFHGAAQAAHFLVQGVGHADVFQSAELLDNGAVDF